MLTDLKDFILTILSGIVAFFKSLIRTVGGFIRNIDVIFGATFELAYCWILVSLLALSVWLKSMDFTVIANERIGLVFGLLVFSLFAEYPKKLARNATMESESGRNEEGQAKVIECIRAVDEEYSSSEDPNYSINYNRLFKTLLSVAEVAIDEKVTLPVRVRFWSTIQPLVRQLAIHLFLDGLYQYNAEGVVGQVWWYFNSGHLIYLLSCSVAFLRDSFLKALAYYNSEFQPLYKWMPLKDYVDFIQSIYRSALLWLLPFDLLKVSDSSLYVTIPAGVLAVITHFSGTSVNGAVGGVLRGAGYGRVADAIQAQAVSPAPEGDSEGEGSPDRPARTRSDAGTGDPATVGEGAQVDVVSGAPGGAAAAAAEGNAPTVDVQEEGGAPAAVEEPPPSPLTLSRALARDLSNLCAMFPDGGDDFGIPAANLIHRSNSNDVEASLACVLVARGWGGPVEDGKFDGPVDTAALKGDLDQFLVENPEPQVVEELAVTRTTLVDDKTPAAVVAVESSTDIVEAVKNSANALQENPQGFFEGLLSVGVNYVKSNRAFFYDILISYTKSGARAEPWTWRQALDFILSLKEVKRLLNGTAERMRQPLRGLAPRESNRVQTAIGLIWIAAMVCVMLRGSAPWWLTAPLVAVLSYKRMGIFIMSSWLITKLYRAFVLMQQDTTLEFIGILFSHFGSVAAYGTAHGLLMLACYWFSWAYYPYIDPHHYFTFGILISIAVDVWAFFGVSERSVYFLATYLAYIVAFGIAWFVYGWIPPVSIALSFFLWCIFLDTVVPKAQALAKSRLGQKVFGEKKHQ